MRSEARVLLAQMTVEHGASGVLRLETHEGADLPPGSTEYPPCQCPQHRAEEQQEGVAPELSTKSRSVNERSLDGWP
jgi:hypothetical protein